MLFIRKLSPFSRINLFLSLPNTRAFSSVHTDDLPENKLKKQLYAKIKTTGPITIAEFMKEALINPSAGYYIHQNAIGRKGDFITSPEISQMFGELIGIWCIHEWTKLNCPDPFHIVELGPGTGALLSDITRTFRRFSGIQKCLSLHLVEISSKMQMLQEETLCKVITETKDVDKTFYKQNQTKDNIPIYWYRNLKDVPSEFAFYIAHEFFDALPIHKFKKTENGWREILIDVKPTEDIQFNYVLSPQPTLTSRILIDPNERRDEVEASAEAAVILENLCTRLKEDGGFILIVDYGHDGTKSDTFRAFHKHQLSSPLTEPGTADLTADVDFSFLKRIISNQVLSYGPINQATFLKNMQIEVRLKQLMTNSSEETKKNLMSGYNILVNPKHMGERFKFLALYPSVLKEFLQRYPPAGFT